MINNKKNFKILMLVAVNLAILILISDFCTLRSYAINLGENGERIAELQKCLRDKECYNGEINGLFDFTTKKAVKIYKKQNNILEKENYNFYTSLGLNRTNCRCYGADIEILAKHLKSKGIINYPDMISECENIIQKSENSSIYRYIIDISDDINLFLEETPDSEQYSAAYETIKRYEINPVPF